MISLIKKKGINPQTMGTLYFPQWTRFATINKTALAKIMARGSTYSTGEVEGVMTDFAQHIFDQLLAGNAVQIEGLGTFKLKVSGKSATTAKAVTSAGITANVVFVPEDSLTSRLNDEADYQFITRVTADGQQDVDDDTTGTDTGTDTGGSGSDSGTSDSGDGGFQG